MENKEAVKSTYHTKTYSGLLLPVTYRNYVKARWMRSYRKGNDYMRLTNKESYFEAYDHYISGIFNDGGTKVTLAVLSDDPDVALGFAVTTDNALHYVYVGSDYRKHGIGKTLVPCEVKEFTHLTTVGLRLWHTKAPNALFNPFQ